MPDFDLNVVQVESDLWRVSVRSSHGFVPALLDELVSEVQRSIAHLVDRDRFELSLFSLSLTARPPHFGFDTIWVVVPRAEATDGATRDSERHRRQLAESVSTLLTYQRRRARPLAANR